MFIYTSTFEIFYSILKSFILIIYLFFSGRIISNYFTNYIYRERLYFFHFLIGYVFNAILINYLVYINYNFKNLESLLYLIYFITILFLIFELLNFKNYHFYIKFDKFKILILLVCTLYFFLAISPITSADSLDYHLGVPLNIYKYGITFDPFWFNSSLSGISDNFLVISFVSKTEQFGTLIQYFSLLSIVESIYLINNKVDKGIKVIFISLFITLPILLFLTSSPKPQLNSIAIACLIFFYINVEKISSNRNLIFLSILIIFLSLTKFNYTLTSLLLFLYLFFKIDNKYKFSSFIIISLIFLILYLPIILFKSKIHGIEFIDLALPFPHNYPGYNNFISYLRNYSDSTFHFPISLIVPSSLGTITTVMGINVFILIYILIKIGLKINIEFFFIVVYLTLNLILGQKSARFFLDIYIFIILYILIHFNFIAINFKYLKFILSLQLIFISLILIFTFFKLTSGLVSLNKREEVLLNNADGYNLSKWVNSLLPKSSKVLLDHRSVTLFNQNIVSTDWSHYVNKNNIFFYDSLIKSRKLNYILIINDNPKNSILFRYCSKLIYGPYKFSTLTRNPFHKKSTNTAWIYESIK